jgi:hypothetical protein
VIFHQEEKTPVTKKTPLSIEQHRELGQQLHHLQKFASRLAVYLNGHYPANSKSVKCALTVTDWVDKLQAALDSQFAKDHTRDFVTHVYYPVESESPKLSPSAQVKRTLQEASAALRQGRLSRRIQ